MKKLLTLALLAVNASAWAQMSEEMAHKLCAANADLAEASQMANQSGMPLTQALSLVKGPGSRALVVSAYARPRWVTSNAKQHEIAEFRDMIHVACLRSLLK